MLIFSTKSSKSSSTQKIVQEFSWRSSSKKYSTKELISRSIINHSLSYWLMVFVWSYK